MVFLGTLFNQPPTVGRFRCVYHFAIITHIILKNIVIHKSSLVSEDNFSSSKSEMVVIQSRLVCIFKNLTPVLVY